MKTPLLSLLTIAGLLMPTMSQAYFAKDFQYKTRTVMPGYVQDPSLDFLPGWPDWIGRLNLFSQFIYGKRYQNLTASQKAYVEQLSKDWPGWIGVPSFLRK
ncbi:MAG: hypothetical protein KC680_00295 [Candidatus Peregrinibacteria bacterium]|nr:hypothetical protein [Candidatus Peregrinibacteria bacterium]MCB9807874.1 hypothetical protein [Candidatus Peribacteria bacterium]